MEEEGKIVKEELTDEGQMQRLLREVKRKRKQKQMSEIMRRSGKEEERKDEKNN